MSVSNNSPTIPVPSSLPIGSFSVNNVGAVLSSNSGKSTLQTAKVPLGAMATTAQQLILQESAPSAIKSDSKSTAAVSVSVAPKQIIPAGAIITIAASTRSTVAQPAKTFGKHQLPVRPLPITALSHAASRPTAGAVTTVSTALVDPGGGYTAKPIHPTLLPGPAVVKPAKGAQHILMAPGLRTPAPSIKLHQAYSGYSYISGQPQITTSIPANKQSLSVTTPRVQQPLLVPVRSIYPPPANRTAAPLAMAASQDANWRPSSVHHLPTTTISISIPARPSSQQDSLLSSNSARISLAQSQGGKPLYQIGISQAHSSTAPATSISSSKVQRKIVAPPGPGSSLAANRGIPHTSSAASAVATSVTAFTYSAAAPRHASIASITTSAIPVAKIIPSQQPPARIHGLQPPVTGISAHVRTTEFLQPITAARSPLSVAVTTTQPTVSIATVVTSLASTRPSTQSMIQPLMYWQSPINLNPAYPAQAAQSFAGSAGIRPSISLPASNAPVLPGIRINPSNLLVVEAPRVPTNPSTFTQVSTALIGNDQTRLLQPHLSTSLASAAPPQHVPTMSPKPAILRRPTRTDANINKKLTFNSETSSRIGRMSPIKATEYRSHPGNLHDGGQVGNTPKPQYPTHDVFYSANIKPALPGQVSFPKPIVTSNGLPPNSNSRIQNNVKDYSNATYAQSQGMMKDPTNAQVGRHASPNIGDVKIKTEYPQLPFTIKTETASSHLAQQPFHSRYHQPVNKPQESSQLRTAVHHNNPQSKFHNLQQRGGMLTVAAQPHRFQSIHQHSTAPPSNPTLRHAVPNMTHVYVSPPEKGVDHKDIKIDSGAIMPPGGLKRDYDKMVGPDIISGSMNLEPQKQPNQNSVAPRILSSGQESPVGLSPRKKPRKQTHVVAEELPDADHVIDDEMSTDDADECEDEVSPSVLPSTVDPQPSSTKISAGKIPIHVASDLGRNKQSSNTESKNFTSTSINEKIPTEYVDKDGVRYVAVRERPPISLLNGHRQRTVNNHFTHYSDVKVKEKKTTMNDPSFNWKYLKGWKIVQFASQLEELALLDSDALRRIDVVKEGLMQHSRSIFTNANNSCETGCMSPGHVMAAPSPGTPCSVPSTPTQSLGLSSFTKPFTSAAGAASLNSPSTPMERKASRFREEILKIEDMAQANIQRCNVMQEQLSETKSVLLKVFDHRAMVNKMVEIGRDAQRSSRSAHSNTMRSSKKKKS